MSYCVNCKRYQNGALSCAGCGAEVGADGQLTMPLPVIRTDKLSPSTASGAESLSGRGSHRHGRPAEPGEPDRPGSKKATTSAVAAAAVVVTVAVGAVIFATTTGGQHSTTPVSHNSVQAGPGLPAPLTLPSAGASGSASGQPASARAGSGASASSGPRSNAQPTAGGGVAGAGGGATTVPGTPTPSASATGGSTPHASVPVSLTASQYTATNSTQNEPTADTGGGDDVGYIDSASWLEYGGVNFGTGMAGTVQVRLASQWTGNVGTIQFRLDSLSATPFATLQVTGTGGWQTWTTSPTITMSPIPTGTHNVYVTFVSNTGGDFVNLNWIKLS